MLSNTCQLFLRIRKYSTYININSLTKQSQSNFVRGKQDSIKAIFKPNQRFVSDDLSSLDIVKSTVKVKKKTPEIPKITLLDVHDNITVTTHEAANKIAQGNKLRLVKVMDNDLKSKRPVFKLMNNTQYLNQEFEEKEKEKEEKKSRKSVYKGVKRILATARIAENDLKFKLDKTVKWVQSNFETRVIISGSPDNTTPQEKIYKKFEEAVSEIKGRIVQKRIKNGDLKFQILPPKVERPAAKQENEEQMKEVEETGAREENEEVEDETSSIPSKSSNS